MPHYVITGGIASGKSVVSRIFEILGAPVFYSDARAQLLMENNVSVVEAFSAYFGHDIYIQGKLNKPLMAQQLFGNVQKRQFVNELVHPIVLQDYIDWRENFSNITFLETALLLSLDFKNKFEKIIVVDSPDELRKNRLMLRDGISSEEADLKMKAQPSRNEYIGIADLIIRNDDENFLILQVLDIFDNLILK